jgi:hypothetical protein
MYIVEYRTKYDGFCFDPRIEDLTTAEQWYLHHVWRGCPGVRLQRCTCGHYETIWETPDPVIRPIDNPHPTEDLPF